jgi:drug/metabolite transporter (DMT)-like permease
VSRASLLRLIALMGITAIWGWTFVVVKDAISIFPVAGFLAYRFLLAIALLMVALPRMNRQGIMAGIPIGLLLGTAFVGQTIGLHRTLASDTGLITGLFVVFVPLIEWRLLGVPIRRLTLAALGLALAGLVLLVGGLPQHLAMGDLLVALSAVGFAGQIILMSRRSPSHDALSLTLGQTLGAATVFVAAALLPMGGGLPFPPAAVWPAIVITATLATVLGFAVQAWVQRELPATPAAMVLLAEPAWATVFGVALSANPFPPSRILGALLLLLAPLLTTVAGTRRGRRILIYAARRFRVAARYPTGTSSPSWAHRVWKEPSRSIRR